MIDLYYWPTPNGQKVSIALEELALPYRVIPVNIGRGDQFKPEFLAISPNNKMPALVDDGRALFESGAILVYLAEKTGKLLGDRYETLQWLFWQVAGLGPMAGQANHFKVYAEEKIPYAIDRYMNEFERLLRVADKRLADREYLAGSEYTIADIASYPWVKAHERLGVSLHDYPNLERWSDAIAARPAVQRGMAVGSDLRTTMDGEARKHLFGRRDRAAI